MRRVFQAYGLKIFSEIDLQVPFIATACRPDVVIRFGAIPEVPLTSNLDGVGFHFYGVDKLVLRFEQVGTFLITGGKDVIIEPEKPVRLDNVRQPILGTVMAMILQQRGCLALHGSAVLVHGRVVLLLGWKGQGKSTLAAFFNNAGHRLVSDDVCALTLAGEYPVTIRPSFPRLRLNPDVILHMKDNPDRHPRAHPDYAKRVKEVAQDGFCQSIMPVGVVCTLNDGEDAKIENINGMDGIKVILAHMLLNRFPEKRPGELQKEIFFQSSFLAKNIPLYRLTRPKVIEAIDETMSLIEATVRG